MSSILGIDLSTKYVDLVKLDEAKPTADWQRIKLRGPDALQRLRQVPRAMPRWTSEYYDDVLVVGIENPMGRGEAGTQAKLNQVVGAVIACIPPRVEVWDIRPHEWRHDIGLPGNARKDACRAKAIELGADHAWADQDAYDAFCVAWRARTIYWQ